MSPAPSLTPSDFVFVQLPNRVFGMVTLPVFGVIDLNTWNARGGAISHYKADHNQAAEVLKQISPDFKPVDICQFVYGTDGQEGLNQLKLAGMKEGVLGQKITQEPKKPSEDANHKKSQYVGQEVDDPGWVVTNERGEVIALVETEKLADILIEHLG